MFELFLPTPNFSLTDEIPSFVHESESFSNFCVDSWIVSEVLDVQVLYQLLLLLLGERTVQELGNLVNNRAQVSLHVLVEYEEQVGMVPLLPGLLKVREEGSPNQLGKGSK